MFDVAAIAGVSHQTVSRVVNNHSSILPATRLRVEEAMKSVGYRPNLAAQSLKTSRSKMLGILASDTNLNGPASAVQNMEKAARLAGYFVVTCAIDAASEADVQRGIDHLNRLGIEGLLVVTPDSKTIAQVRRSVTRIPVVTFDSGEQTNPLAVSLDNFAGGFAATQHLIDLGHEQILHISGPTSWVESSARLQGYEAAMLQHKLTSRVILGDWSMESGYEIARARNFKADGVTAIFAASDHIALGVLRACHERGLSVPGELSIVGFDDLPESAFCWPPLTTIRQDFQAIGERAIALMLAALGASETSVAEKLKPELVVRESTSVLNKG